MAIAVLSGCSRGETANETLPEAPPSATETSEALPPLGPPDLPMPPEAREQTPAGAEAALRYYLQLVSHQAGVSGQTLRDLSRDCEFCDFIADRYDEDASAGNRYTGGELTVRGMSPPALDGDSAEFSFTVDQAEVGIIAPDGSPVAGRGQAAVAGMNAGARMTWSDQAGAWFLNQLIINS
ncbi:hypothetical protein [Modestobacter sp. VKM Ac-2978]|uniref:hypothetical protein n=1 Tax=Modestobacter sp. VKM Ac-2978 TaxID=3004132 RepID=UPI0022AA959B|nr:hypothetical protein [Modestobacter sp. VKM Ac-2978]MCZ2846609.1 hypothetical protein [Modestobacter sp. VKM Ac-2978]